jgi:methyltransferase (TIGR00027 family)
MSNGADQTAAGVMLLVAIDQAEDRPLIDDELAYRMLPAGTRLLASVCRWRPVRRLMINVTERAAPGGWASLISRKRYIDDRLAEAVEAGIEAVVILGAGFDTRAYRPPLADGIDVYEVDLPVNVERKKARLRAIYGDDLPKNVTLVPVDFEKEGLAEALAARGYRPGARTFFVWEGVIPYLTEEGVRATFDVLATAPTGSRMVFTYVRADFIDGTDRQDADHLYRQMVARRRMWHFGLNPGEVAPFIAEYGWREVEQLGPEELRTRYVVPTGRNLGALRIERSVYAEKD